MVSGDLTNVESLKEAVAGSYAVYGTTNYWEIFSKEKEFAQGKAIADASFAAGVKHIVFSSLPYATKISGGKLTGVDHFDGKAQVEEYIEAHKAKTGTLASYFMPAVYMSVIHDMIRPNAGKFAMNLHIDKDAHLPLFDVNKDSGKYVLGAIEAGAAADGHRLNAVGSWTTPAEALEVLQKEVGGEFFFNQIPRDVFKSFLPPAAAEDLTQNMDLINEFSYYGKGQDQKQGDSDKFLVKGTKPTTWAEYVKANGPWEWKE